MKFDQYRIVNLLIGSALPACVFHILRQHVLAALLDFAGDCQECLQFVGNPSVLETTLYIFYELFVAAKLMSSNGAVNRLAIKTIVLRRDIGGNQLAFSRR
mgnify:CR=1 FL=1